MKKIVLLVVIYAMSYNALLNAETSVQGNWLNENRNQIMSFGNDGYFNIFFLEKLQFIAKDGDIRYKVNTPYLELYKNNSNNPEKFEILDLGDNQMSLKSSNLTIDTGIQKFSKISDQDVNALIRDKVDSILSITAKNQCVTIATALCAYKVEYGKLPDGISNTVNKDLVYILTSNNPNKISFLTVNDWKTNQGGLTEIGFCPPFDKDHPYNIILNTNSNSSNIGIWTIQVRNGITNKINSWD